MSDRQSGVTSAASKHSGLSCRWALVLQRSGKKWPIFFLQSPEVIMWETSRKGSGFPLPACSFCCPQKNQTSLTSSVFTNSIFPSIVHVSFALYDSSSFHLPTSSIKRQFFALVHVSEDLSSSAGVHLSASSTSRSSLSHPNIPLCAAAVKCLVVMVTTPQNDRCPADICRAPKARVEYRPGGTVSVWALCLRQIRANNRRT